MDTNRKIVVTDDGSHTFYVPSLNEHYHSHYGSIRESQHVFIDNGLHNINNIKTVNIIEIGFGTGLNALLTLNECIKSNFVVNYFTVEKYPLTVNEYMAVNYSKFINFENSQQYFVNLHECNWNIPVKICDNFTITKVDSDFNNTAYPPKSNLIYFDAFGPDKQPDLWNILLFKKLFSSLSLGGILVTYSAKGQVKRDMQAAGFSVKKLDGPPGKRHMLFAQKLVV